MKTPSIKRLMQIDSINRKQARIIKAVLCNKGDIINAIKETRAQWPKLNDYLYDNFTSISLWINRCHNCPTFHNIKIEVLNALLSGYGVEFVQKGRNAKSPFFEYVNLGDTYTTTLIFVNNRYIVASYGDLIEKGNYD